ncbi:hypothetical protein D3C78_1643810 [compost metagenome]
MKRNIPKGSPVTLATISDIPVIPPSIILFGTRNSSKDTPAIIAPTVIKNTLNTKSMTFF